MISIRGLSFKYAAAGGTSGDAAEGGRFALSDINLEIAAGDFVGIIGASGAGKSTLTYAINSLVPHYFKGDLYGSVTVDGRDTVEDTPERVARVVGSVFQDVDAQIIASVVEDEILFGLENFGVPHGEIAARVTAALEEAGIPELRGREISSLSGGQKQKIAIAAIIALRPKVIVLDEPTGELDPQASRRVFETLRVLNERHGVTVVIVEQKIMLLCEFAKRLVVMDHGRLLLGGEVRHVLREPEKLENAGVNIPRVASLARGLTARGLYDGEMPVRLGEAERMMRGVLGGAYARNGAAEPPRQDRDRNGGAAPTQTDAATPLQNSGATPLRSGSLRDNGDRILRFDGVSFGYQHTGRHTVDDVSFSIAEGEFVALLGENGAGKSTLARLCNGLIKPVSGRVAVCGHDTSVTRTSKIAREVGFLFQNPDRQLCQTTIRDEIMFGLECVEPDAAARESRCAEMLERFSLDGSRAPFDVSRGERQQVALACVLACGPRLLILDEPTTGLDYSECMDIMSIISDLHARGATVLMISHDMEVVADFAERALVLSSGRLIRDGTVREVMRDTRTHARASLLPAQIPALALRLGDGFEDVYTVDDMLTRTAELSVPGGKTAARIGGEGAL